MTNIPDILTKANRQIFHESASEREKALMEKLDNLVRSPSPIRYFAELYIYSTQQAIFFYKEADADTRDFIERLEIRFAQYFFAAIENESGGYRQDSHWQPYFSHSHLKPVQYYLIGANAHINGDIWKSLVNEFSYEEIKRHRQNFLLFNESLKPVFHYVYENTRRSSFVLRCLHCLTVGRSHHLAFTLLKIWRRQQIALALLYFTKPHLFHRKEKILRRAIALFNRIIITCV